MARFPDLLAQEAPEDPKPDPIQEQLKALQESQAAAALADRERAAAEAARMEQLERLYQSQPQPAAPAAQQPQYTQVPQYSQDELLADPNKIYEVVGAAKQQGQQEIINTLAPVLENMSEGTYIAAKSGLANHPYYKYAESALDEALAATPGLKADPKAVRAKFNEIVGENVVEYQAKVEAEAPASAPSPSRRMPVVERQVRMPVEPLEAEEKDPVAKAGLSKRENEYREFFNKQYGLNSSPEEYAMLKKQNKYSTDQSKWER